MGLLAPLFLLGLAGLVVPIVVHLTEKQRRKVVDFPSLMFLRKIPFPAGRDSWPRCSSPRPALAGDSTIT